MLSRVKFLQRKSENFILKFHLFSPIKMFPVEYFLQQKFPPESSFLKYNFRWEMACHKTNIKRDKMTYCKSWHYHFIQMEFFLPAVLRYLSKTHHIRIVKPACSLQPGTQCPVVLNATDWIRLVCNITIC